MISRAALLCLILAAAAAMAACGKTERSGDVGEELSAKGLRVTVQRVDTTVPMPERDITGLSRPAPGFKLVGARVRVCSNHGAATGPFDFGIKTTGDNGRLKFPQANYPDGFEALRTGCGSGWVVFEVPRDSTPTRVTYGFDDTGSARPGGDRNRVKARFSWAIPARGS